MVFVTLREEMDELRRERDEARDWVRRLTSAERVLTCAFCGEAYPPGTPDSNHERLTAHVMTCAKHPMRGAEAERDRLAAQLLQDAPIAAEIRTLPACPFVWHCPDCGAVTPHTKEDLENGYEAGAAEPCLMCDGTARVRKAKVGWT